MASASLLSRVPVGPQNIYRIPVEAGWKESADAYEAALKNFYQSRVHPAGAARVLFDLVVLGVGHDGHTASIFPGSPALDAPERWVAAIEAPAGVHPRNRITLTVSALSSAGQVLFFVAGNKRDIVRKVFETGAAGRERYPAARIAAEKVTVFATR